MNFVSSTDAFSSSIRECRQQYNPDFLFQIFGKALTHHWITERCFVRFLVLFTQGSISFKSRCACYQRF